jgi:hypothetical protein
VACQSLGLWPAHRVAMLGELRSGGAGEGTPLGDTVTDVVTPEPTAGQELLFLVIDRGQRRRQARPLRHRNFVSLARVATERASLEWTRRWETGRACLPLLLVGGQRVSILDVAERRRNIEGDGGRLKDHSPSSAASCTTRLLWLFIPHI